ncbi:MAG: hypothetical protein ACXWLM_05025 [Myxococcales bacterium]
MTRSGAFWLACAASFAWMACDAVPRAGPGLPGGPAAPPAATPSGRPKTASIGPAGDTLTFGARTLTVPPGAGAAPVDFTLDEVTPNTAVGASGSAYLVGPSGAALFLPVTLTFAVADSTGLGLSHQDATGYWLRDYTATRTATSLTATIGPAGDTLTFGPLTLTVPPGAVATPVDFTIDEVTPNTAVGASGSAYLVGPSGAPLLLPVTLTFAVADSTGLGLSHQDATGYWVRDYSATRTATSLTATTRSLGTWSAVALATSRDLTGPLRIDSTTEQIPFSASGTVTLQYIGEEPGFIYYMPTGSLAPSAPACVPDPQPATPLPVSVAEIHGTDFRVGVMTQWTLACGDGSHPFVSTNFDTMGITNSKCMRGYDGASLVDPSHLQGRYVIDCGAGIQVVATWDLTPPP